MNIKSIKSPTAYFLAAAVFLAIVGVYNIMYTSQTAVCTSLKSLFSVDYIVELNEPYMRVYRKGESRRFKDFFVKANLDDSDGFRFLHNDLWGYSGTFLLHFPSSEQYRCVTLH